MRVLCLAALFACLSGQAFGQQSSSGVMVQNECTGGSQSMHSATVSYQAQMASLRSSFRTAPPASASKAEREMYFRRYEAAVRDIREKRATLLGLYRHLSSQNCPGYSVAGLNATIVEYNRLATAEHSVLIALRDAAGIWVAAGAQDLKAFQ